MPNGRLSTHVLDLTCGRPAAGVGIELFRLTPGEAPRRLASVRTNADGRTDAPLLSGDGMMTGTFELVFNVGDYFEREVSERFLDRVPVRFSITDAAGHYHVPLLVTPWAYQTYRGS